MAGKDGTYSDNPGGVPIDAVRLHTGDTDCAALLLSDGEVQYLLDQTSGDTLDASVLAAEFIAAGFARQIDNSTGRVRKSLSQKFSQYKEMASNLRSMSANGGLSTPGVPIVDFINTGERIDADETDRQDTGLKQPNFDIGGADNPRTDSQPRGGKRGGTPTGH